MYTPPVGPVATFSERPAKFADVVGEGWPAPPQAAKRTAPTTASTSARFISCSSSLIASLGRAARPLLPELPAFLGRLLPALLVRRLGHERRDAGRLAVLVDRDEHEVGRRDVGHLSGQDVLGL